MKRLVVFVVPLARWLMVANLIFCTELLAGQAKPAADAPEASALLQSTGDGGLTRWSFSAESAYTFQAIANPFFALAGQYNKNPLGYHVASQILAARYQLTDDLGSGWLRGNWQASGGLLYSAILRGPETFYGGALFGFRYNFSPEESAWSPYAEVRGGLGWTDSRGFRYAQQQDFTFVYLLGVGVRYKLSPCRSISLGALDQHLSNAYLTQPNYGFDSLGFSMSAEMRF